MSWKARDPMTAPVVFDDSGRPKSEAEQRAYHLFQAPVDYGKTDAGRQLKELRDLHDTVIFADAYASKTAKGGQYNINNLKSYRLYRDLVEEFDPGLAKAMASTTSGYGDEWVPTEASAEMYTAYELEAGVESHIPHWSMPSNPATWPIRTTHARMYRASEATVNNPTQLTKSTPGTSQTTFTTEDFAVAVAVSPTFIEDSIVAVVPALRADIAYAMATGYESLIINGDSSATHQDTGADWATDTTYPESYEKGFRYMALNASGTQAFDTQSSSGGVGDGTTAWDAKDGRYLRQLLPGKYGHKAKQLVYVTSLKVWLKMLSWSEYSQVGTYGANASWLTGDLPSFDGSPLVLSGELLETMAATGLKTGADSTKGMLCFNKSAFKIGTRRGITIEFDKDILTQQFAFVGTQRKSFQSMDSSGAEAVSYGYNIA